MSHTKNPIKWKFLILFEHNLNIESIALHIQMKWKPAHTRKSLRLEQKQPTFHKQNQTTTKNEDFK